MPITDDDEPTLVMLIATCHTEGCKVEGVEIAAPFFPNAAPPIYRGVCGECGKTHTDLAPAVCDQCAEPITENVPTACSRCGHTVEEAARGEWPPEAGATPAS